MPKKAGDLGIMSKDGGVERPEELRPRREFGRRPTELLRHEPQEDEIEQPPADSHPEE